MNTRKKQKRELILESTYDIFVEKGYTNTKIIEIAKHAGIGKGTVYEYFDSKEAIFMALFDYFTDEYKTNYEYIKSTNQNKTSAEKLKLFIKYETNIIHYMCHTKKLPPHLFLLELLKDTRLSTLFEQFVKYRYHSLLDIISEGISSGEFQKGDPTMYTIGILGATAFYIDSRNKQFLPQMLEEISVKEWSTDDFLSLILNGLQKKE